MRYAGCKEYVSLQVNIETQIRKRTLPNTYVEIPKIKE